MKRPRLASEPIKISSLDWTMFSGGDEAIIIGRLPNGQLARRSALLTTPPAASRAAIASLSLMISGRSDGFGTLLNQSAQFPEPGSSTNHIPEISVARCAARGKKHTGRISATRMILLIDSERIQRVSCGNQNILAAVDHVCLRRIRHLSNVAVP